jgi:hypothetical protein
MKARAWCHVNHDRRAYVIPAYLDGDGSRLVLTSCAGVERERQQRDLPTGMPAVAPSGTTISSHITTVVFDDYTRAKRSAPRRRAAPPPTRASPPIKRRVRARLHRVRASRGAVVHVPDAEGSHSRAHPLRRGCFRSGPAPSRPSVNPSSFAVARLGAKKAPMPLAAALGARGNGSPASACTSCLSLRAL